MKAAVVFAAILVALSAAGLARASEIIDRDVQGVKLAVNAKGQALLTYRARGRAHRVVAWGASRRRMTVRIIARGRARGERRPCSTDRLAR